MGDLQRRRDGGWGPLLEAGCSRQEEPWGWGGGFGALLPLHPVHTHTPNLCPPPLAPSATHTQKEEVQFGEEALAPVVSGELTDQ